MLSCEACGAGDRLRASEEVRNGGVCDACAEAGRSFVVEWLEQLRDGGWELQAACEATGVSEWAIVRLFGGWVPAAVAVAACVVCGEFAVTRETVTFDGLSLVPLCDRHVGVDLTVGQVRKAARSRAARIAAARRDRPGQEVLA